MITATDSEWAPWFLAHSDDKKRARLNIITHMLSQIPYETQAPPPVKLPRRQPARGYQEPDYPFRYSPTPF